MTVDNCVGRANGDKDKGKEDKGEGEEREGEQREEEQEGEERLLPAWSRISGFDVHICPKHDSRKDSFRSMYANIVTV